MIMSFDNELDYSRIARGYFKSNVYKLKMKKVSDMTNEEVIQKGELNFQLSLFFVVWMCAFTIK